MNWIVPVLLAMLAIFVVISVHEWGHFIVARICGVKVLRFSLGFGKTLCRFRDRKGTEFCLSVIPLGGYVKMLDETEMDVLLPESERPYAFNRQHVSKRIAIALAGPFANFVLAFVIYAGINWHGQQVLRPEVGRVVPQSIMAKAGIHTRDEFVQVAGVRTYNWQDVMMQLLTHVGSAYPVPVTLRDHQGRAHVYRLALQHWRPNSLKPNMFHDLGFTPYAPQLPAVVGKVEAGSPAAAAHLQSGDRIVRLGHHNIQSWQHLMVVLSHVANQRLPIVVRRDGKEVKTNIALGEHDLFGRKMAYAGIQMHLHHFPDSMYQLRSHSFYSALSAAALHMKTVIYFHYVLLKKLMGHDLSPRMLGGPVTIVHSAMNASLFGWAVYFSFMALVSVSLGLVNLLPIPGLDGGHLLFYMVETVTGQAIAQRWQLLGVQVGMLLLLSMMIFVTWNDVARLA